MNTEKLKMSQCVYYGIGSFGIATLNFLAMSFIMAYYTDVIGISMSAVSLLILIVRFFDAANDPLIGSMADRSNSRFGKYKPWVVFGGIAWGVFVVLMFSADASWDNTFKIVWMYSTYIFATVAGTCANMSYYALNNVMSGSSADRYRISSIRMIFNNGGALVAGVVVIQFIAFFGQNDAGQGYFISSIILCAFSVVTLVITGTKTKENLIKSQGRNKIPLKKQFATLFKNPPMLALCLGMVMFGIIAYGRIAMLVYYFKYFSGDPALLTIYNFVNYGMNIVGCTVVPFFLKRVKGKGTIAYTCMFVGGVFMLLSFWTPAPSLLFWVFLVITSLFQGAMGPTQFSMLGDVTDFGEYKTGVRCDGFLSALGSFGMKMGGAIGPAVAGVVLDAAGFIPNITQTPEVLSSMNILVTIAPGVLSIIIGLVFIFGYKLTTKELGRIRIELDGKNEI